jgi:heterodisulfide reductase subunit C
MTIVIARKKNTAGLMEIVREISGIDVEGCLQCKKCSNGCPVSTLVAVTPSELIRRLQLGADDSVLNSELVWTCASCETCFTRCPMKIDTAAVIDALRVITVRSARVKNQNVPLFNKWFLRTVKIFGRTYDLGMIAGYKIGTSSYRQDSDKIPVMLRKRKIAFLPSLKADKTFITRIFKKFRTK